MIDQPGNSAQCMTKPSICQEGVGAGFKTFQNKAEEPYFRSQETCSVACCCVTLASSCSASLGLKHKEDAGQKALPFKDSYIPQPGEGCDHQDRWQPGEKADQGPAEYER